MAEMVFTVNSREQQNQGSAITRFLGRGVRGALPNSLDRSSNWQDDVTTRGETRQRRVTKKGRTVGKKEVYTVGEKVKLQDIKTKRWNAKGTITEVRTAADGTIVSYGLETSDGSLTTRHRKYIQKIPKVSIARAE